MPAGQALAGAPARAQFAARGAASQTNSSPPESAQPRQSRRPNRPRADRPQRRRSRRAGTARRRQTPLPNLEALSRNVARLIEEGGKVLAAYIKPRETGGAAGQPSNEIADAVDRRWASVAEYYCRDAATRARGAGGAVHAIHRPVGGDAARLQRRGGAPIVAPDAGRQALRRSRMASQPLFRLSRAGLCDDDALGQRSRQARRRRSIRTRATRRSSICARSTSALSPSNFVATNPELMRTTLAESGDNLVRGLRMMAEDIEAGHGNLRIRQSDASKFMLGVKLAATPGKVVFRNELIELIQYAPTTPTVYKRPLLIVPPWINKFYVLDLNPEKSFIRWAVGAGPDGVRRLLGQPRRATCRQGLRGLYARGDFRRARRHRAGDRRARDAAIGYCVGGTLLAIALAFMARDRRQAHRQRHACSPRRSISPTPATSRCSSTPNSSRRSSEKMAEHGLSRRLATWPTPSTCCGPTI